MGFKFENYNFWRSGEESEVWFNAEVMRNMPKLENVLQMGKKRGDSLAF